MKKSRANNPNPQKVIYIAIATVFWLLVWQLLSMVVKSRIILPGPADVVKALGGMIATKPFWKTVLNSFLHIVLGFAAAVLAGTLLAVASSVCKPFEILVSPLMRLIKAVPVASFIILILLWISSKRLPFVISFLMVLPVIYVNVVSGIRNVDSGLLEMAKVFRIGSIKRIKHIYIPAIAPHFVSAVKVGLGFCWKSGIAAEVISLSPNTIGSKLYDSKLYLSTDELFAWTVVIVVISVLFEKLVMELLYAVSGVDRSKN